MNTCNNSPVGSRVIANGYPGTVTRNRHSEGSAWLGEMVEVRLARGTVCIPDRVPDVIPASKDGAA